VQQYYCNSHYEQQDNFDVLVTEALLSKQIIEKYKFLVTATSLNHKPLAVEPQKCVITASPSSLIWLAGSLR